MADDKKPDEQAVTEPKPDAGGGGDDNKTELDNYGGFKPDDPVVKIAMRHGWKPNDQLPEGKTPIAPDKYIDSQWDINRVTNNNNRRLERQVEQLTKSVTLQTQQNAEATQRDIDDTRGKLKDARKEAAEAGDTVSVEKLSDQLEELAAVRNSNDTDAGTAPNPAVGEWARDNSSWYRPGGEGAPDDVQDVIEVAEDLYGHHGAPYLKDEDGNKTVLNPAFIPSNRLLLAKINKEVADYVQNQRPDLIGKYEFNGIQPVKSTDGKAALKAEATVDSKDGRQAISDVEGSLSSPVPSGSTISRGMLNDNERRIMESSVFNIVDMTEEKWLKDYNAALGNA